MKKITIYIAFFLTGVSNAQYLENYIKIALENNSNIQKAYYETLAGDEKIKMSSSFPETQIGMGGFISPVATRLGDQRFKISIHQPVPFFGTLKTMQTAAYFESNSLKAVQYLTVAKIVRKVKECYFDMIFLQGYLKILKRQNALLKSLETAQIYAIKVGKENMVAHLKIKTKRLELQAKIKNEQRNLTAKKYEFNLILNRSATEKVFVSEKFPSEMIAQNEAVNAQNHPEHKALKAREKALEAQEKLMQKKRLPRFSIGLNYINVAKRPVENLSENGRDILMPTIGMKIPIFSKKYSAGEKQIQLQKTALKAAQKTVVNTLKTKEKITLTTLKNEQENYRSLVNIEKNISEIIAILNSKYENQNDNFSALIDAQESKLKIKIRQLATLKKIAYAKAFLTFLKTTYNE